MLPLATGVARAIDQLELAARLLEEFGSIGLWIKADDCSDNWARRRVLREADWAVADASRAVAELPIAGELRELDALLETLPDRVSDIWLDVPYEFGKIVTNALERVNALRERLLTIPPPPPSASG